MIKLPIYNIELGSAEGILKMSLVEYPAVESDFLAFDEQKELKFSIDEEQRIVFGCSLRSDFPIYRRSSNLGEYYVVFTKEVIKELYEKFMIDGRFNNINLNHDVDTNEVYLLSAFIKDTKKGLNPVGFEDINDGSLFTGYKIENDEVWEKVKSGELKGFSVEGFFELEEEKIPKDEIESLIDELLKENSTIC